MIWIVYMLTTVAAFFFMEFFAWFMHKYVMHGFMWNWHQDHHITHDKKLEKNDRFVLLFAVPGIAFLAAGFKLSAPFMLAVGVGISFYGLAYFLFHDVYVHQRIKTFKVASNKYLRATKKAHQDHHKPHSNQNFGFLIAPLPYYQEVFRKPKKS